MITAGHMNNKYETLPRDSIQMQMVPEKYQGNLPLYRLLI